MYEGHSKSFANRPYRRMEMLQTTQYFSNIIPTEFNEFATFFWQAVNSTSYLAIRL